MLLALVILLGAGFGGSFVGGVIYGQTLQDEESELSPRLGTTAQFQGGGQGAAGGQRGQGRQVQGGGFAGAQGEGGPPQVRQSAGEGGVPGEQARQGRGGSVAALQSGEENNPSEGQISQRQTGGSQDGQQRSTPGVDRQNEASLSNAQPQSAPGAAVPAPQATPVTESGQSGGTTRGASGRGGVVGTVQGLEADLLTVTTPRGEMAVTLSDSTTVFQVVEATREDLIPETGIRVVGSRNPEGSLLAQTVVIVPEGGETLFGPAAGRQRGGGP